MFIFVYSPLLIEGILWMLVLLPLRC